MQSLLLPYNFPRPLSEEPETKSLTRDAQISKNLQLEKTPAIVCPVQVQEPYVKVFSNSSSPESLCIPKDDAIDDILRESKNQIEAYSLDLPYTKMFETETKPSTPRKIRSNDEVPTSIGKKRSWNVLDKVEQRQLDLANNVTIFGDNKTPTLKSVYQIEPSSSAKKSKGLRQSTPVSDLKNPILRNKVSFNLKNTVLRVETAKLSEEDEEETSTDPLACHAENIMRMAMDSTMLGSFNNSFSSTFSNLLEDSILGKKYPDVFHDHDDPDKSLVKKKRSSLLDKQRATKVEISASDLQDAVNEPYFIK